MRKVWRLWLVSLCCLCLILCGVYSTITKAAEVFELRFRVYYYAVDDERLFNAGFTKEINPSTGLNFRMETELTATSKPQYAFIHIFGLDSGTTYSFSFGSLNINNSFVLKQAYLRCGTKNVDFKSRVNGNPSSGYSLNMSIPWSDGASQIVLYFENPNPDEYISTITTNCGYCNLIAEGNGQAVAVSDIQNNTTDIKTDTGNIFTSILELPQKIYDKILDLFEYVFIPDPDEMQAVFDDFETYIAGRLGFLGQSFDLVKSFFQTLNSSRTDPTLTLPKMAFPMNGEEVVISEARTFSFADLDEDLHAMQYVRLATSIAMVIAIVNLGIKEISGFLGNKSEL